MSEKVGIKEFAKSSLILTATSAILKAINFVLLPLYTRYLSPTDLGISDTITNFTAFLLPLLICGFDSAFSVFYFEKGKEDQTRRVYCTTKKALVQSSLIIIILFISSKPLSILLFKSTEYYKAINISLIGTAISMWMLSDALSIRMQNRMWTYGVINIIASLSMIIMNIFLVVILKAGYISLIISSTFALMIQAILFRISAHEKFEMKFYDKKLYKRMLLYALPLVPVIIVNWILSLSDRYILLYFWNEEAVGIYGIAQRFANILNIIVSSVATGFVPFAFNNFQQKDANEKYRIVLNYVFIVLAIIVAIISTFSSPIIKIMADERYYSSYMLVQPLMFGQLCYSISTIIGYGFAYVKKSKYFIIPSSIAALLNIVLNFIYIPKYGAYAATLTTLCGYLVMMIVTYFLSEKVYPCKYDFNKILIVFISLYALSYIARDLSFMIQVIIATAQMVIIILAFRKELVTLFVAVKRKFHR